MELIHTVDWMRQLARKAREEGRIVGLVPTRGGLHGGHLSLARAAVRECSPVVVSVINDPGDRSDHPADGRAFLEADRAALETLGVDYLFAPTPEEFYPSDFSTSVVVEEIADRLEGRSRPGRLRFAATMVLKLFTLIQPALIYVGRKQAQQACMLGRMARDLNLDAEIVVCPIVREPDGLAIGSRNGALSENERRAAAVLYRALSAARDRIARGERMAESLADETRRVIATEPLATIDYLEIVDADSFQPVPRLRGSCLAVLAAFVGSTRLTDNMRIEEEDGRLKCAI